MYPQPTDFYSNMPTPGEMYPPYRTYPPMSPTEPIHSYPAPGQIYPPFPPTHPFPATSRSYPYPFPYPSMHPYYPPGAASSQIYSSYPPIYPPAPSQMDSSSSYSSRSSGEPSELSEEPLVEELGDPDKSEALFSMYLDRSDEDDRKTTERWKGECDAILIFTGLFSAALAALLSISVPGLQQNPQDTSAFYLGNIYHLLASTTTVHPTPSDPPKFSPPTSAVLVNSLWFLSLVMSLTGALIAVFIQQWAQSYLQATQERHSPKVRARIRTFYAEGIDKLYLHRATRAVPILIHVSLFLFFSGLPIFLFNVNRTVFNVVVAWLALCVAGYACITLMPIICQDSPYYSPLSSSTWWCAINTLFILYRLFKNFIPRDSFVLRWYDAHYAKSHFRWPTLRAMQKAGERFAQKLPSDIDYRALSWMLKTLNDDAEFEEFFDALPSLCDSKVLEDAQTAFVQPNEKILSHSLIGMMDRTLLSELVPEEAKQRRIIICTKVIGATSLLEPLWILRRVLIGDWKGFSRSIHFGLFVQSWKKISDPVTAFYAQYVVAVTLACVQERDDRWFELASGQLYESKSFLRNYYISGDSILLVNTIFIIRRAIQTFSGSTNRHQKDIDTLEASSKMLELVCRFNIQNTLAEHQHVFCSLWNQLVDAAQNNTDPGVSPLCVMMLKSIRRHYVTLHRNPSTVLEPPSAHLSDSTPLPRGFYQFPPNAPLAASTQYENPSAHLTASSQYGNPSAHLSDSTPLPRAFNEIPQNFHLAASTQYGNTNAHLAASTPYRYRSLDDAGSYTKCILSKHEHRHTTRVPELPLQGLPIDLHKISMDKIREITSLLVPVMPATYSAPNPVIPSPVALGLSPKAIPTAASHPSPASSYHPASLDSYSRIPDPYSRPAAPSPPSDEIASSTTRVEADSRRHARIFHEQFPYSPEVSHRKRVGFVGVPSTSTSRSSSPALPALQEEPPIIREDADILIPTPVPIPRTPSIPRKVIVPETPFVPSSRPLLSVPQGPPVEKNADLIKSPVVMSSPLRDEYVPYIPPDLGPSRGSIGIPPEAHQSDSVSPPDTTTPVQVPQGTDSTSDVSFATARSASSSPAPLSTPVTDGGRRGRSPSQTSAIPSVIEFNGYEDSELSGLLYYSLHSVLYEDELYPTALHLFEACKFLPHRPDLADRVRQCERVQQVPPISAELANFVRRDWGNIMVRMMDKVLYLKFSQHNALRTLLFGTYPAELVYIEPREPFWGRESTGAGRNELGKSLMRVRERFLEEGMQMTSPPPGWGDGAVMTPILKINGYGEYSGLLYHSPHSVVYEEDLYPTALHLFLARKFLDHRPDLADRIRQCEDVVEVTALSAELAEFARRDWPHIALSTMDDVLYQKFLQHADLRALLRNTFPADLLYVEPGDPFWGEGAGTGMNELGKSLMRVRERLFEAGMRVTSSLPLPGWGDGSGMAPVLKIDEYGEHTGLLYHTPHGVVYEGNLYPTALHLFEARKFLDHRPDLADRIRQCEHVEDVTAISAEHGEFVRRDWGNVALSTMDEVLYLKFRQHADLRVLLLNTFPADIVYVEPGDPFWGEGAGAGLNELGKSLMRVRQRLRIEGGI